MLSVPLRDQLLRSHTVNSNPEPDAAVLGFPINIFQFVLAIGVPMATAPPRRNMVPHPPPPASLASPLTVSVDRVLQDNTQHTLGPAILSMQRAARNAYLDRLSRVSDRDSLQRLEAATLAARNRARRLDRKSLRRLEAAARRREQMAGPTLTPPPRSKLPWRYNDRSSPFDTDPARSSGGATLHSLRESWSGDEERSRERRRGGRRQSCGPDGGGRSEHSSDARAAAAAVVMSRRREGAAADSRQAPPAVDDDDDDWTRVGPEL